MAMNYYDKFVAKLQEIFMMDHAELDFGIYRIMNQKRDEIQHFLQHDLLPQVKIALQGNGTDSTNIKKRMKEIETSVGGNVDVLPQGTPIRDEYDKLKAQLAQGGNAEDMEGEVFSHLATFFSRYYDGGDFLSKRRYKDNTYAIPYNGEEVKLHWANSDQYYIKTSEYFRDYTFVLPTSRRKVHFVLKDASTEQNNNRAANNMERRFALYKPENEDEKVLEVTDNSELNIYFTYELMPKTVKQDALRDDAVKAIQSLIPAGFEELLTVKAPTAKDPNRTLLEKHLTDYTAKNSFDYFIHKDLGGFLSRELDSYIKNEVLHIDDLDPQYINNQLLIVKAIKQVGQKIIKMLAQLENFQKKLWLKKKFVVQSDYCITLDRVPEKLYPEIIANEAQRKEWVRLFAIDEIQGNMMTAAYSEPLTIEFLKQNKYLVLDTAFFDARFKHQLVKSMENIDEQTNGLLINSENFQALQLLQEKYNKRIRMSFVDPPYNTEDSEGQNDFNYKDCYQHSSWLSLYKDRLELSYRLLNNKGIHAATISDAELLHILNCYNDVFRESNRIGIVEWNSTKSVTNTALISMGHTHIPIYAKNLSYYVAHRIEFRLPDTEDGFSNPDNDPRGKWKADPFQVGGERPNQLYDIVNPKTGKVYRPNPGNSWKNEYSVFVKLMEDNRIVFGSSGDAGPQRKRFWVEAEERGRVSKTWWDEVETTTNGTTLLKNIFGICPFKNPKPLGLMTKIISLCSDDTGIILDYFGGSGTTVHGVIQSNRDDNESSFRKYITCEMGAYFDSITRPRVEKVIYSECWKDGKPVSRNGVSQCFKYIRLEQYEDTLNNLEIKKRQLVLTTNEFKESYMLSYMLDVETQDSLLNLKWFENPFEMTLKTTKDNELVETKVDMVETFNYLIGLNVETEDWYSDDNICVVQGRTHREGLKTLVIWRNCKAVNNEQLCEFFKKMDFRTNDTEFDIIYVNGDNTLPNLRRDEEHWKLMLTEEEFQKRMFEEV